MKPVITLLGRPNVGKSTLFNRITRTRDALVDDEPGVTRDRLYGVGRLGGRGFLVVDTGGLDDDRAGMNRLVRHQVEQVVRESSAVILVTDGRDGLSGADGEIAAWLRRVERPVFVAVNKSEGLDTDVVAAEFHVLALGAPHAISAKRGDGVARLVEEVLDAVAATAQAEEEDEDQAPRIAVLGRPNVGKSTLVNALLGEDRVIVSDEPGTTRDSVRVPFEHGGRHYVLVDTAGIRRRARIRESLEQLSVVKSIQAMDDAHVVVLVLDAVEGVQTQDATIAGWALESGRSMVVALNKWDRIGAVAGAALRREVTHKLTFLTHHDFVNVSALRREGLRSLLRAVDRAFDSAMISLDTSSLNRHLRDATRALSPPLRGGRAPKLKYAHQGGRNPPLVIVHGTQVHRIPESYRRYLQNYLRKAYSLSGTNVRVRFRRGENPFAAQTGARRSRRGGE